MPDLSATKKDFEQFKAHMPWTSKDDALIVLKGHLLVEELLREYCGERLKNPEHIEHADLKFAQIVSLTRALLEFASPSWIWGGARLLNGLRNKLAHRLVPKGFAEKRTEFIAFIHKEGEVDDEFVRTMAANPPQDLIGAVFILHTRLSAHLRFKPVGLMSALLALPPPRD